MKKIESPSANISALVGDMIDMVKLLLFEQFAPDYVDEVLEAYLSDPDISWKFFNNFFCIITPLS